LPLRQAIKLLTYKPEYTKLVAERPSVQPCTVDSRTMSDEEFLARWRLHQELKQAEQKLLRLRSKNEFLSHCVEEGWSFAEAEAWVEKRLDEEEAEEKRLQEQEERELAQTEAE
jgi:hypothetical protein